MITLYGMSDEFDMMALENVEIDTLTVQRFLLWENIQLQKLIRLF